MKVFPTHFEPLTYVCTHFSFSTVTRLVTVKEYYPGINAYCIITMLCLSDTGKWAALRVSEEKNPAEYY